MLYGDCIAHNNSPYSESNSSGHRSNASCIQAWTLQVDSPRLFPGIDLHMEAEECELLEVGTHPPVPILKVRTVRTKTVVQISMQCYRGVSQKEGTSSIQWALPPWSSLTTSGTLSPQSLLPEHVSGFEENLKIFFLIPNFPFNCRQQHIIPNEYSASTA